MAKTIATYPLRITDRGGIAEPASDDPGASLDQVIAVALKPGSTMHPWDYVDGLVAPDPTFRKNPAPMIGHVEQFFDGLRIDGRATLTGPIRSRAEQDGKTVVQVQYFNLESNQPGTGGV